MKEAATKLKAHSRDHELQAGPGQTGADWGGPGWGPSPETAVYLQSGCNGCQHEGAGGKTWVSWRSAHKVTTQHYTRHTILLHTSYPTAGARNKPGTRTPTMSKDPEGTLL